MFTYEPIGYVRCSRSYHQEQPMQGVLSTASASIELVNGFNFEQALKDLSGFERIWIIYVFHRNTTWKPLTNPPYSDGNGKKGVFATRSPYRPNNIGISCVKLTETNGRKLLITDSDLLDGTPVLDIKPYIPQYDSFPDAKCGWLENVDKTKYAVSYEPETASKIEFLRKHNVDLNGVIDTQLAHNPFDKTRNKFTETANGLMLRFRSWKIRFDISESEKAIKILSVESQYKSYDKLLGDDTDIDLSVHKLFNNKFRRESKKTDLFNARSSKVHTTEKSCDADCIQHCTQPIITH